jgi:hypothetical protein
VQVWLPLNVSDTAPMRWNETWVLGPLAATTAKQLSPAVAPRLDFAALVNGGHSPFPVPHDAYGPPLQYFAIFMLILIALLVMAPFVGGVAACWCLIKRVLSTSGPDRSRTELK